MHVDLNFSLQEWQLWLLDYVNEIRSDQGHRARDGSRAKWVQEA